MEEGTRKSKVVSRSGRNQDPKAQERRCHGQSEDSVILAQEESGKLIYLGQQESLLRPIKTIA